MAEYPAPIIPRAPSAEMQSTSAIKPLQTMRGHTNFVKGVAHLPDGRRIITGSRDGSLRLWNLESGVQIGNDWRDDREEIANDWRDDGEEMSNDWRDYGEEEVQSTALSPNGKGFASGSRGGIITLWDIETKKIVARWTGHTGAVSSLCWSADGERVVSCSGGKMRVRDVKSGDTVLGPIKTGHEYVSAVMYSPDTTQIATGGIDENAIKIWDAKTGNLLSRIKHPDMVWSLAWASDQKKFITGDGTGLIRIFDTATWQQIAFLDGHTDTVWSLALFQNRLLASASDDRTARLWNLDTNLPVGPPLQHKNVVRCAAIFNDGKLLATGSDDTNAYVWDIHTILKDGGLEELLSIPDIPQDGFKQKSLMDVGDLLPTLGHECHETTALPSPPGRIYHRHSHEIMHLEETPSLYVAWRPEPGKEAEQQQGQSESQAHVSTSQTPPAVSSMSTRPPPVNSTTLADPAGTQSQPVPTSKNPPWWVRLVYFVCCAPVPKGP